MNDQFFSVSGNNRETIYRWNSVDYVNRDIPENIVTVRAGGVDHIFDGDAAIAIWNKWIQLSGLNQ